MNLEKGGSLNLTKESTAALNKVMVGIGWDPTDSCLRHHRFHHRRRRRPAPRSGPRAAQDGGEHGSPGTRDEGTALMEAQHHR